MFILKAIWKKNCRISLTWKIPTELKQVVVPSTVTYNGIVYTEK